MVNTITSRFSLACAAIALLVAAQQVRAQERYLTDARYRPRQVQGQASIRQPGSLQYPGNSSVSNFTSSFAYGLGPTYQTPPTGLLSSNISSGGTIASGVAYSNMNTTFRTILPAQYRSPMGQHVSGSISGSNYLSGQTLGSSPQSLAPLPPTTVTRRYTSGPLVQQATTILPTARTPITPQNTATAAATTYLETLLAEADSTDDIKPIRSLIPLEPGPFRNEMVAGERAFRMASQKAQPTLYDRALRSFKVARAIDPNNPEANLSMAHTYFAMDYDNMAPGSQPPLSYGQPAIYLAQASRMLPELALLPLEPREFWGQLKDYGDRLAELEEYCEENPSDADALMLLAYFKWFDGETDAAVDALIKAYPAARRDTVAEAIETFWDGMKASGRLADDLSLPPRNQGTSVGDLIPPEIPDENEDPTGLPKEFETIEKIKPLEGMEFEEAN